MVVIFKILMALLVILIIWQRGNLCATIAKVFYARGKSAVWKKWFSAAKKLGGMSFNNKITHAYLMLKEGELEEANKLFALLTMEQPDERQKLLLKGSYALVFWKRGEVKTAIEMLEEVAESAPNTSVYGSLGYMYVYNGKLSKALEFNLRAYEYNDSDAIIVDNLAYTYYKMGELEKAKEYYEKLIGLAPTFPEAYYGFGRVLVEMGEVSKGIEMTKRALGSSFSFLTMVSKEEIQNYLKDIEKTV